MIKTQKGLSYFGGHFVCKGKRYVPILFQAQRGIVPFINSGGAQLWNSCYIPFSIFMIAVEKHFEVPTFDYWIGASFDLKGRMWRKECFLLSPEVEKHADVL